MALSADLDELEDNAFAIAQLEILLDKRVRTVRLTGERLSNVGIVTADILFPVTEWPDQDVWQGG